jgi:hypothetical protein
LKVTVPLGDVAPAPKTMAVKVTEEFTIEGLADEVTETEEDPLFTV